MEEVADELTVFMVLSVSEIAANEVFNEMPSVEFGWDEELQLCHNLHENLLLGQTAEHAAYLGLYGKQVNYRDGQ